MPVEIALIPLVSEHFSLNLQPNSLNNFALRLGFVVRSFEHLNWHRCAAVVASSNDFTSSYYLLLIAEVVAAETELQLVRDPTINVRE